jgi:pyruvate kinase
MPRDPAEHRRHDLDRLDVEVSDIERELDAMVVKHTEEIGRVNPVHRSDAVNLLHYLALRRHDSRVLQRRLSDLGLSSRGRCEPHVMASLLSIHAMVNSSVAELPNDVLGFRAGRDALDTNTDALFGDRPHNRVPRIMVTLDDQAGSDPGFVRGLLAAGMDIARINGAHDDPEMWDRITTNVELAAAELGVGCRIAVDLAGPKLRTGQLVEGPRITRLRPRRDARGRPVAPAVFELSGLGHDESEGGADDLDTPVIPVDRDWLLRRRIGEEISILDARGANRRARITRCDAEEGRLVAEIWDTTYFETGLRLSCGDDATAIGLLRAAEQCHVLAASDLLSVMRPGHIAVPWHHGDPGIAEIACSLDAVFESVVEGDRILLDDGKFSGRVEAVEDDHFLVKIVVAPIHGGKLRAEKGINLPDTELDVPLVSDTDLPLMEFAARRADMLSVSFLRREDDVDAVRASLARMGAPDLAIVLKIETQAAFTNLPTILLHAMRSPRVGVMIARGDLAVEMGYPRLAEVQEEILWLAESAHLPVIWATEVLDRLATTGRPSRAEVTDAAMAQRAECVMLNKGPYIALAIAELDDILRRMARHQRKNMPLLRSLNSWADF